MPNNTYFITAVINNSVDLIQAFLQNLPWTAQAKGATLKRAMFCIGSSGSVDTIETLLAWAMKDPQEETGIYLHCALLGAIQKLRIQTVEWHLNNGVSLHPKLEPLAFLYKDLPVSYVNPLHAAAREGSIQLCELFLSRDADIFRHEIVGKTHRAHFDMETALHIAAGYGYSALVEFLLIEGAKSAIRTGRRRCALQLLGTVAM
jgi:hypothetical protein